MAGNETSKYQRLLKVAIHREALEWKNQLTYQYDLLKYVLLKL